MANLTLNGWIQSVATGVVETVPLQDLESALVLAEDFLGTQGGWNPDDVGDPTGPGVPVSGISTNDAIVAITLQQRDRIYHVDSAVNLNVEIILNENLTPGLSDDDVVNSLQDRLEDVLRANLSGTNIRFVSVQTFSGDVTNGPTDTAERIDIQNTITGGGQIINAKAIGLIAARGEFNLDNTWNVQYLYAEDGKELFVMVVKYTDALYANEDDTATNRFGMYLDPITYQTSGGVILPLE